MTAAQSSDADLRVRRQEMVEQQIRQRGVTDTRVLDAMRTVPRERFVPPEFRRQAYDDGPLPIGAGQTISQPYIVAYMTEALKVAPSHKVLEVGAGSGYAAAVISRIAGRVIAIERQHELVEVASERIRRLGYYNVEIVEGDGTKGCRDFAPYDAILAAASGSHVPRPLIEQLAPNGRIVMPVGDPGWVQELVKVTKQEDGILKQENLGGVRFVPLIGEEGWKDA
jgi:protein-L-isoaspartate(D-aspartate) O-methyltransferase